MARAKQTNRAEARRRYRQTLAQTTAEAEGVDDAEAAAPNAAGSGRPAPAGGQGRPSIGAAFRQAYHPAHYGEDLRALPGLLTLAQPTRIPLTRTVVGVPWFLVSALLVILGFAALAIDSPVSGIAGIPGTSPIATLGPTASAGPSTAATAEATAGSSAAASSNPSAEPSPAASPEPSAPPAQSGSTGLLLFQFLSYPPGGPTLPVLLVGFMATRASYLQGLLIGLLDLVLIVIYVVVGLNSAAATESLPSFLASAAITGLPTSILFAGAAAWYRRFLLLSSPRRPQPAKGSARGQRSGSRSSSRR